MQERQEPLSHDQAIALECLEQAYAYYADGSKDADVAGGQEDEPYFEYVKAA